MREIAAASDFDFVAFEPRQSEKGSRKRAPAKAKSGNANPSRLAVLWRYRTPAFGSAILAALLGAIVVNAMFLQHGRHPAPLFGSTLKIEVVPKPPVRPASIDSLLNERIPGLPLRPADPAPETAFAAPEAQEAQEAQASPAAAPTQAAPPPARKGRDAIGALIADNGVVAPASSGKSAMASAVASVLAAQRALQKLGAPVKPDGEYGAATRKAVEAFQRENRLLVNGELNARTRRLLSARSGLPVD